MLVIFNIDTENEGDRFSETFWGMTQHSWMSCIEVSEEPISHINPLNAELNPICHLLALLSGATIVVVSRLRVKHLP